MKDTLCYKRIFKNENIAALSPFIVECFSDQIYFFYNSVDEKGRNSQFGIFPKEGENSRIDSHFEFVIRFDDFIFLPNFSFKNKGSH